MQKPKTQANRLPPPHTLILGYTMTHIRFGRSHVHPMSQLTTTRSSDGTPDPDGSLKKVTRIKIRHHRNVCLNHPDPIAFIPLAQESDQFRFLRASCFTYLKGTVGLIMEKASDMRISIPLDLSSRPSIPFHRFQIFVRVVPHRFYPRGPSLVLFPPCSA